MKEREKEALFALLWNLFSALSPSHPAKVFQSESVRSLVRSLAAGEVKTSSE